MTISKKFLASLVPPALAAMAGAGVIHQNEVATLAELAVPGIYLVVQGVEDIVGVVKNPATAPSVAESVVKAVVADVTPADVEKVATVTHAVGAVAPTPVAKVADAAAADADKVAALLADPRVQAVIAELKADLPAANDHGPVI